MPPLVYKSGTAQQWPSWVVPLESSWGDSAVQRIKAKLGACVQMGTLQAYGLVKQPNGVHLLLHFTADKQACDVRRLLEPCQALNSLDLFHVEQFGWEPPEEIYKKAEEAVVSGDFDRLRHMFPGLADYTDRDFEKNPYLGPALRALCDLGQPAIEDCPHKLSGAVRPEHTDQGCCGHKKRRVGESCEVRWFCTLCNAVWCNSHGLPHRKQQQEREQLEEMMEELKPAHTQRAEEVWAPHPPTLQVRSGRHMSTERKIEWILHRAPILSSGRADSCLPIFYETYLALFKRFSASHDRNLQQQAFDCFGAYMRLEHPDYKGVVLKSLPLSTRCEVESIAKGREVSRCGHCSKTTCKCQCHYCPRLGPHDCRLREEWRNPVCQHCHFKGKFDEQWVDDPLVYPRFIPGWSDDDSRRVRNRYRAECRESGKEIEIWGQGVEEDEEVAAAQPRPVLTKVKQYKMLRCPKCRMPFRPASARPASSSSTA